MIGNNPYAMGTVSPGAMGMMRGMGMGQPQGPINAMRQPEQGQMLAAPQEAPRPQYPDLGQLAGMAKGMQGLKMEGQQAGKDMMTAAGAGQFQGPMPNGGNLTDVMQQRGQYMNDNPLWGGFLNRYNML